MIFDPDNHVIKLCVRGMDCEGTPGKAVVMFLQAWCEANTNVEKFIAAHYVARHQNSVSDKLDWNKKALSFALLVEDESIKQSFPSLCLNIAKCYEHLVDNENATKHHELAESYSGWLADDGYGKMIREGIRRGMDRVRIDSQRLKVDGVEELRSR